MSLILMITLVPLSGIIKTSAKSIQYALFPMEYLSVSQTYYGATSHYPHTYAYNKKVDYPIDINGKDSGQDDFKAPFDLKIVRVYGVNDSGANTFWFESLEEVYCADGTKSKVCGMVTHPSDADMPKVGQVFQQKDVITKEGTDGPADGNHIHLSLGKGTLTGDGWVKNSNGKWVLTCSGGAVKPESILYYTDENIPKRPNGIEWKKLDVKDYSVIRTCDKIMEANESTVIVREGPAKTYNQIDKIPIGKEIHAVGYYVNYYNHIWYKVEYDGKSGWIYSERLKNLTTYKITYDAKGGTGAPSSQTKKKNQSVHISNLYPTKANCQFVGWSTNSKVSRMYYDSESASKQVNYVPGAEYSGNSNLKLYAVWLETKTSVSLSSNKIDLCLDDKKTETVNVSIKGVVESNYTVSLSSVPNVTAKASSISVSLLSKLRTIAHIIDNKGSATITLTAKEKGNSNIYVYIKDSKGKIVATSGISVGVTKKYKINYNANGGTGAPSQQTRISGKNQYLSPNVPTKTGYCFMGWATPSSNGSVVYGPGDIYNIDSDITLTAVWGADYYIGSSLSDDGKILTISGHGDMPCYGQNTYKNSDWNKSFPNACNTVETIQFVASDGGIITSIGSYAFAGFNKLTNITIPVTVTRIYSYAFYNCGSLTTVNAPKYVTLGSYAFANCGKLSNYSNKSTKKSVAALLTTASVEEESGSIGAFAFENCVNLQSIDISSVSNVGESAFSGCTSLSDIILSDELTVIEDCAFYNCLGLSELEIPNNVTEISEGAFSGCASLNSIEFPETLSIIDEQAFSGCSSIESIVIPDSVENIGSSAFSNCTALENVELADNTFNLSDSMFSGCTSLQSINIPDSVTNIGDGTFFGCSSLSSVSIPDTVSEIGDNTFAYCEALSNIDIPDSVSVIKDFAFFGCSGLENVDFSANLDTIGMCAFGMCSSLESIVLPESLSSINEAAFSDCTSLKNVVFEESMVSINDEAFIGCTSLENVKIPECAVYISSLAFDGCDDSFFISCYSSSDIYEEVAESGVAFNTIYPVEGVDITGDSTSLQKGESVQLNPVFNPNNATNKAIIWFSENEDVAVVSNTGLVTAIGSGTATIVAVTKEGDFEATYEVECTVPVEKIEIEEDLSNCYVGTEMYLIPNVYPQNPTNMDLIYSSSDTSVATVSEDGLLSVISEGTAEITICSEDSNSSTTITLNAKNYIPVKNVEISSSSIELYSGDKLSLDCSVTPINASLSKVKFISEDENIAVVDENGVVTAKKPGVTTIEGYCGGLTANCNVIVNSYIYSKNGSIIDNKSGYIYGLSVNLKNINNYIGGINEAVTLTSSSSTIGTGTTVSVVVNENAVDSYDVVIFGDVNGDGWYDGQDAITVSCLANGMLTREQMGEAVWMAADCNHDGVIDQADVDLLNQAGVLLSNVDQTKSTDELIETSSEYVEYLNLIDQQTEAESNETPENNTEATEDNEEPTELSLWNIIVKYFIALIKKLASVIKVF